MIPLLFILINVPVIIFIGLTYGLIPYLTRPELVFGIRIKGDVYNQKIKSMKFKNLLIDLLISIIFTLLTLILYVYINIIVLLILPLTEIILVLLVYFYFRSHVRLLKINLEDNQKVISSYIPKSNIKVSLLWYVFPWIELMFFIIIGIIYYPHIPSRFPTHFGLSGKPNEYASKSPYSAFFLMLFVGVPVTVVFDVLSYAIQRSAAGNSPTKKSLIQFRSFNTGMVKLLMGINLIIILNMFLAAAITWELIPKSYIFIIALPVLLIFPLILWYSVTTGQTGWKKYPYLKDNEHDNNIEDDKEWAGGLIYHNKEDNRILVPKRYGIGYTLNFSNRWSYIILIIIFAVIIISLLIALLHP
ncbi:MULTISPECIES: DUF1648 domain-containing protein [Acidiplasma]|uniref:DUF1648 domain-containing protein n=1 Tax=Acidiplasma cupricumulans TaxID=312540 RepID=A0A0Q0RN34_9ARCH|nr:MULTISPECIES: DUF1648 domain-containing protein [Acidiplasma]KJE49966.1 hypothetical protein TZ01_02565 [Acidiplasma sp. MBA-1]KQB33629.1 hypothetical protein AOG55_00210 [Acidiplasma cupricumulans]WMT55165.1 MAG: DUF1648 domain-containing protein [Acidiplasma sp.]